MLVRCPNIVYLPYTGYSQIVHNQNNRVEAPGNNEFSFYSKQIKYTYIPPLETLCCITSLIQVCGKNQWTIIVLLTFVWKK